MEGKCIVSSCGKTASKCCGSCGWVRYCSVECQKEDWKKHHKKNECVSMKKLASVKLTEKEITDVACRISRISCRHLGKGEAKSDIDMYKECLDFVRDRLGRLDYDDSRSLMRDGLRLNHITICSLLVDLGQVYFHIARSSESDDHGLSYISEARELLVQRKDAGMNETEIWPLLSICDHQIYKLYIKRGQLEKAKYHAVESVATARQCNVTDQVDYLIIALGTLSLSLESERKFPEALALAEESYIIASKHYSPAHRTVMDASGPLINCLIAMKDYSTADTYCRMNYANIIDPKNAGEYVLGQEIPVMNLLTEIWLFKEPDEDEIVEKALADEAIDLSRKVFKSEFNVMNNSIEARTNHLSKHCRVLLRGNELTKETEGLMHQFVTTSIAKNNLNRKYIHDSFMFLYKFYTKLNESFLMGKKTTFVQENIELCAKKSLELQSCNDGSVGYVKMSQKIKPYFKGNVELHI